MEKSTKKTFGILGAGNIAQSIARHLLKEGYEVTLSNSKGADALKIIVGELGTGAFAGTILEAAKADIVLLAVPWTILPSLKDLIDWKNKVVIDAMNPFITFEPMVIDDLHGKASSEVVAATLKGAIVIKAFNTLYFKILEADPKVREGRRVIFYAGDNESVKSEVHRVIESIGFAAIDSGPLSQSKIMEPKGALSSQNLVKLF